MAYDAGKEDDYVRHAGMYDPLTAPLLKDIRNAVCAVVQSYHLDSILDMCCGTGYQAILLRQKGLRVVGLDISPQMLSVARKKSGNGVAFVEGDACHSPFQAVRFEGIIVTLALHEKERVVQHGIMEEAKRLLKQGGRIILVDYKQPLGIRARLAHKAIHLIERAAGREHYRRFRAYLMNGGLEGLLNAHGLIPEEIRYYHFGATELVVVRPGNPSDGSAQ